MHEIATNTIWTTHMLRWSSLQGSWSLSTHQELWASPLEEGEERHLPDSAVRMKWNDAWKTVPRNPSGTYPCFINVQTFYHYCKHTPCQGKPLPPTPVTNTSSASLLYWTRFVVLGGPHMPFTNTREREDNERQKRAEHLGSQLLSPSLSSGSAQHIPRTATPTAWKPGEFHPPCHQVKATRSPFLP